MRYSPGLLGRAVGLPAGALPLMGKCPLCRAPGKLYVGSWERIVCWGCGFHGGVAALLAAMRGLTVGQVVADLIGQRALEAADKAEVELYRQTAEWADGWRVLHRSWSERLRGHGSTTLAILERRGVRIEHHLLDRLIPHFAVLNAEDLKDCTKPSARRGLGQRTWLGMAVFHEATIVGYWMIGQEDVLYCPLETPDGFLELPGVVGMGLTVRGGGTTVVCDDPVAALRLIGRSLADEGSVPSCVALMGGPTPPWLVDTPRDLVWWPGRQNLQAIGQALRTARASTVAPSQFLRGLDPSLAPLPCSWRETMARMSREVLDPARALVVEALALDEEQARATLTPIWGELTAREVDRVMAACSAEEALEVRRRLGEVSKAREITWKGRTIRETDEGWWSGEQLVSQAILRVEEIEPDGQGDGTARGVVVVRGTRLPFTEALSKLRKQPTEWLHGFVLDRTGRSNIVDRAYRLALLDIAQLFWEPRPMTRPQAPATEGVLHFPGFTIDRLGLHTSLAAVEGPSVPYPVPLTTVELRGLSDPGQVELLLALLGNLIRQARGLPGLNLAVQGRPFVWERVAGQLGLPVAVHLEHGRPGLWPQILRVDEPVHRGLFLGGPQPARAISCSPATFAVLALHPTWLRLTQPTPTTYRALRGCLLGCGPALDRDLDPESATFYRDAAQSLHRTLQPPGEVREADWQRVAAGLDDQTSPTGRQLSTRILRLAWAAQRAGALPPGGPGEVDWAAVQAAYSQSSAPLPGVVAVREALAASRCLGGAPQGGSTLQVDPVVWGLLGSLG